MVRLIFCIVLGQAPVVGGDGLVGQPAADVIRQGLDRAVGIVDLVRPDRSVVVIDGGIAGAVDGFGDPAAVIVLGRHLPTHLVGQPDRVVIAVINGGDIGGHGIDRSPAALKIF